MSILDYKTTYKNVGTKADELAMKIAEKYNQPQDRWIKIAEEATRIIHASMAKKYDKDIYDVDIYSTMLQLDADSGWDRTLPMMPSF